jgi:hypothetical protein
MKGVGLSISFRRCVAVVRVAIVVFIAANKRFSERIALKI